MLMLIKNSFWISAINLIAIKLFPPSSKKSDNLPIFVSLILSKVLNIELNFFSVGVQGGIYSFKIKSSSVGSGKAFLSSFPFILSGIFLSWIK